jgi:hypothetical protein
MSPEDGAGPYRDHVVQKGECITSISAAHGHFWESVWNDPENAGLRELRKHPNILMEGDSVRIPPIRSRTFTLDTGLMHRFRRNGIPAALRLRFTDFDQPRSGLPYKLLIDGVQVREGTLDDDGRLEALIDPEARQAVVQLGVPPEEHVFLLGQVPPVTEISGLYARLGNLGYPTGTAAESMTEELAAALRQFQRDRGIPETGEPDEATREKLQEAHGC